MTGNGLFLGRHSRTYVLDIDTGAHRSATKRDLEYLSNSLMRWMESKCNVPMFALLYRLNYFAADRRGGLRKHNQTPWYGSVRCESARDIIRMAAVVTGGIEELTKRPKIHLMRSVSR